MKRRLFCVVFFLTVVLFVSLSGVELKQRLESHTGQECLRRKARSFAGNDTEHGLVIKAEDVKIIQKLWIDPAINPLLTDIETIVNIHNTLQIWRVVEQNQPAGFGGKIRPSSPDLESESHLKDLSQMWGRHENGNHWNCVGAKVQKTIVKFLTVNLTIHQATALQNDFNFIIMTDNNQFTQVKSKKQRTTGKDREVRCAVSLDFEAMLQNSKINETNQIEDKTMSDDAVDISFDDIIESLENPQKDDQRAMEKLEMRVSLNSTEQEVYKFFKQILGKEFLWEKKFVTYERSKGQTERMINVTFLAQDPQKKEEARENCKKVVSFIIENVPDQLFARSRESEKEIYIFGHIPDRIDLNQSLLTECKDALQNEKYEIELHITKKWAIIRANNKETIDKLKTKDKISCDGNTLFFVSHEEKQFVIKIKTGEVKKDDYMIAFDKNTAKLIGDRINDAVNKKLKNVEKKQYVRDTYPATSEQGAYSGFLVLLIQKKEIFDCILSMKIAKYKNQPMYFVQYEDKDVRGITIIHGSRNNVIINNLMILFRERIEHDQQTGCWWMANDDYFTDHDYGIEDQENLPYSMFMFEMFVIVSMLWFNVRKNDVFGLLKKICVFMLFAAWTPVAEASTNANLHPSNTMNEILTKTIVSTALTVVALNINGGFMDKMADLKKEIQDWGADIVFIIETWITEQDIKTSKIKSIIDKEFKEYVLHYAYGKETRRKTKKEGTTSVTRSKGIIAMIRNELNCDVRKISIEQENRVIKISLENKHNYDKKTEIWGIYGPSTMSEKPQFFQKMNEDIQKMNEKKEYDQIVLIGDINVAPNPRMDRDNEDNTTQELEEFDEMMETNGLTDVWRYQNPTELGWTFTRECKRKIRKNEEVKDVEEEEEEEWYNQRSRIDLVIADSETAKREVTKCKIVQPKTMSRTDHNAMSVTINYWLETMESRTVNLIKQSVRTKHNQKAYQNDEKREQFKRKTDEIIQEIRQMNGEEEITYNQLKECLNKAADKSVGRIKIDPEAIEKKKQQQKEDAISQEERTIKFKHAQSRTALSKKKKHQWKTEKLIKLGELLEHPYKSEWIKDVNIRETKKEAEEREKAISKWWQQLRRIKKNLANTLQRLERDRKSASIKENVEIAQGLLHKDPKRFWSNMNVTKDRYGSKIVAIKITKPDGQVVMTTDPQLINQTIVREWKQVFTSTGSISKWEDAKWLKESATYYRNKFQWERNARLLEADYTMEELITVLRECGNNKATIDEPLEAYKFAGDETKLAFLNIMNICWRQCEKTPDEWKKALIRLLDKPGDKFQCKNKRPISLGSAAISIMMKMFQKRLQNLLEENTILLNEQGGFRRTKATHDKLNTLIKMIMEAKSKERNMYIMFVDIKKCYDSVNHSLLIRTLEAMGFPPRVTMFLENLYNGYHASFIGANNSETETIRIERGIRQGDPASCVLIDLFFDPIIRYAIGKIEGNGEHTGGSMKLKDEKELLQWVDDMALVSWNPNGFHAAAQKLIQTLEEAGLEIGVQANDISKTVIMTNDEKLIRQKTIQFKICYKEEEKQGSLLRQDKIYDIPVMEKTQCYKYLGYWLNIEMELSTHLTKLENTVKMHANFIVRRCQTFNTTVQIIQQIILPSITYKLSAIPWCADVDRLIGKLDTILAGVMNRKLGIRYRESKAYIHLPKKYGGIGMTSVRESVNIATMNNMLYHAVESTDEQCRTIVMRQNEGYIKRFNKIGEEYNIILQKTEATLLTEVTPSELMEKQETFSNAWETMPNLKNTKIGDLQEIEHKRSRTKVGKATKEILQDIRSIPIVDFLTSGGKIPKIKYSRNIDLWGDASQTEKDGIVTYGIHTKDTDIGEFMGSVNGTTSVQRGEILASIHAVLIGLKFKSSRVIIDNQNAVNLWTTPTEILEKKRSIPHADLVEVIRQIRLQAKADKREIQVHQVMAHCKDNPDRKERERRSNINKERFGMEYEYIIEGNQRADELARRAKQDGMTYNLPNYLTLKKKWYMTKLSNRQEVVTGIKKIVEQKEAEKLLKHIQDHTSCFEWLKEMETIDVEASSYIMTINDPKMEKTQKLILRMRRKQISENEFLIRHSDSTYFQDRFGIPKSDKCPRCGEKETRMHCAIECAAARKLHRELFANVKSTLFRHFGIHSVDIPNWINNAEDETELDDPENERNHSAATVKLARFNKVYASLGVIPACLKDFIEEKARKNVRNGEVDKKTYDETTKEIHMQTIQTSCECYRERCKYAAMKGEGKKIPCKTQRSEEQQRQVIAERLDMRQKKQQANQENKRKREEIKQKKQEEKEKQHEEKKRRRDEKDKTAAEKLQQHKQLIESKYPRFIDTRQSLKRKERDRDETTIRVDSSDLASNKDTG